MSRNPGGDHGDTHHDGHDRPGAHRIDGRKAGYVGRHQGGEGPCRRDAEYETREHMPSPEKRHLQAHPRRGCTERHADADLTTGLAGESRGFVPDSDYNHYS